MAGARKPAGDRPSVGTMLKFFHRLAVAKDRPSLSLADPKRMGYAARAGTTRLSGGARAGIGHAKCEDCGAIRRGRPCRRILRPNAFGLYDTTGNAAEWVQDCGTLPIAGLPANGSAWTAAIAACASCAGGRSPTRRPPDGQRRDSAMTRTSAIPNGFRRRARPQIGDRRRSPWPPGRRIGLQTVIR